MSATGPGTTGTAIARARALLDAGKPAAAVDILGQVLTTSPDDPEANRLISLAFIEVGDHANALASARRSAALSPEDANSWILVASTESRFARRAQAIAAAGQAMSLAPHSWSAFAARAEIDLMLSRRSSAGAAAVVQAVTLAPDIPQPHVLAGQYAELRGKPRTANKSYLRALAIDPLHTDAGRLHAALQASFGNGAAVLAGRMDAVASAPDSPEALLLLRTIVLAVLRPVEAVLFFAVFFAGGLPAFLTSPKDARVIAVPPTEIQLLILAVAVVLIGLIAVRTRIQLGSRALKLSRALVPHDRLVTTILAVVAISLLVMVVCPFLPSTVAFVSYLAVAALLGAAFSWGAIVLLLSR